MSFFQRPFLEALGLGFPWRRDHASIPARVAVLHLPLRACRLVGGAGSQDQLATTAVSGPERPGDEVGLYEFQGVAFFF